MRWREGEERKGSGRIAFLMPAVQTCVDSTTFEPILLERPRSAIFNFFPSLLTRMF